MLMVKLTLSCFDGESVNWFKKKNLTKEQFDMYQES